MTTSSPALQWAARADWIDAEDGTVVCLRPDVGYGASWALWPQRKAMLAAAPLMLEALKVLLAHYIAAAESGDCGFWDPEKEPEVIAARAALAAAEAQS